MRRYVDTPRMPGTTGMGGYMVTWSHDGVMIDSAWLTPAEYRGMVPWFQANGWDHTAQYEERASLDPAMLGRIAL